MQHKWAAIQLPISEEGVSEGLLRDSLRKILPDIEIFIPTIRVKDKRGSYNYSLFDGYAFIRGAYDNDKILLAENSAYVQSVLKIPSTKTVAWVDNREVELLKNRLISMVPEGLQETDMVIIKDGLFKNLKGRILEFDSEGNAVVEIYMPMGSLTRLSKIPKVFLSSYDEN